MLLALIQKWLGQNWYERIARILAAISAANAAGTFSGHVPDSPFVWQFISGLLGVSFVTSQIGRPRDVVTDPPPPLPPSDAEHPTTDYDVTLFESADRLTQNNKSGLVSSICQAADTDESGTLTVLSDAALLLAAATSVAGNNRRLAELLWHQVANRPAARREDGS